MPRVLLRLGGGSGALVQPSGRKWSGERGAGDPLGTSAGSLLPVIHTPSSDGKKVGSFARERKEKEEEKAPIAVQALAFPVAGKSRLDIAARTPEWLGAGYEKHRRTSLPGISPPPPLHPPSFGTLFPFP